LHSEIWDEFRELNKGVGTYIAESKSTLYLLFKLDHAGELMS
jgi:hypothetical protein